MLPVIQHPKTKDYPDFWIFPPQKISVWMWHLHPRFHPHLHRPLLMFQCLKIQAKIRIRLRQTWAFPNPIWVRAKRAQLVFWRLLRLWLEEGLQRPQLWPPLIHVTKQPRLETPVYLAPKVCPVWFVWQFQAISPPHYWTQHKVTHLWELLERQVHLDNLQLDKSIRILSRCLWKNFWNLVAQPHFWLNWKMMKNCLTLMKMTMMTMLMMTRMTMMRITMKNPPA